MNKDKWYEVLCEVMAVVIVAFWTLGFTYLAYLQADVDSAAWYLTISLLGYSAMYVGHVFYHAKHVIKYGHNLFFMILYLSIYWGYYLVYLASVLTRRLKIK